MLLDRIGGKDVEDERIACRLELRESTQRRNS
jgi:hypothetical protein